MVYVNRQCNSMQFVVIVITIKHTLKFFDRMFQIPILTWNLQGNFWSCLTVFFVLLDSGYRYNGFWSPCISICGTKVRWIFFFFFFLKRERDRRENLKHPKYPAWSPMWGSISRPWDHDLSQNQESDAQLTQPPRRPLDRWILLKTRLTAGMKASLLNSVCIWKHLLGHVIYLWLKNKMRLEIDFSIHLVSCQNCDL